jgi:tetratricopeptide (TPR) repeat protein
MRARLFLVAALTFSPAALSAGEVIDNRQEYTNCLALAKMDASTAYEHAVGWQGLGGGDAAKHCQAVALMHLGKYDEAAYRLENLAQASLLPASQRAQMLAQAGQAQLMMDKLDLANADQTAAIKLDPRNADLYVDRAVTLFAAGNYASAVKDLDSAILLSPKKAEPYALRAAAKRFQDMVDPALADAEQAVSLSGGKYPEALLERGILRRLKGNKAGARQDWLAILHINPDGETADAARRNLELMDVKGAEK